VQDQSSLLKEAKKARKFNFFLAFVLRIGAAATYSATQLPAQYHRR
jgi:hypothetical protein